MQLWRFLNHDQLTVWDQGCRIRGRGKAVKKILLPLVFLSLFFFSCKNMEEGLLDREQLFVLPLGVMPDEIDYVYRDRVLLPGTADIFMNEGIVYISSQNMGKVMGFNSYGDLLTLLFNSEINPQPRELVLAEEGQTSNKRFVPWAFRSPGELGLAGSSLLVEDQVDSSLAYYDEELNASCNSIILRFDEDGQYMDYLGQEGLGGQPFPFISDISFRENGEVVVLCRLSKGWKVYWYNKHGENLYQITFDQDHNPYYKEGYQSYLSNLVVDPVEYRLFLMVSFYSADRDNAEQGDLKRLYQFNLNTQRYDKGAAVPDEITREAGSNQNFVFELLGVTEKGQVLLISPVSYNRYIIVGMNDSGKILFKREISLGDQHNFFTDFYLSSEGILSSLNFLEDHASVNWWRTDRLFRE